MSEADALSLLREALWTASMMAMPLLVAALVTGSGHRIIAGTDLYSGNDADFRAKNCRAGTGILGQCQRDVENEYPLL